MFTSGHVFCLGYYSNVGILKMSLSHRIIMGLSKDNAKHVNSPLSFASLEKVYWGLVSEPNMELDTSMWHSQVCVYSNLIWYLCSLMFSSSTFYFQTDSLFPHMLLLSLPQCFVKLNPSQVDTSPCCFPCVQLVLTFTTWEASTQLRTLLRWMVLNRMSSIHLPL